jgi:hypothetical protein
LPASAFSIVSTVASHHESRQHCGVAFAAEDRLDLGRFYAHRRTPSEMVF